LRALSQAVAEYKSELARYNAEAMIDKEIVKAAEDTAAASLVTLLESQLARSLRKDGSERQSACEKYLARYASVPQKDVHPLLWDSAQVAAKGST